MKVLDEADWPRSIMIRSDLLLLAKAILLILGAVLPVVNPLGDAPIFLKMTPGCDEATRAFLAGRIAFYSFFLLLGSQLLGSFVMTIFGLTMNVVQVAGGAVVCALAWNVLADIPKPAAAKLDPAQARLIALGRTITPLTLPMTIDAGVIAVAITVGTFHANSFANIVIQVLAAVIGSGVVAMSILVTYRYAHRASGRIGNTGMMVLVRLSAFLMLCIGVGISWDGIKSLLAEVGVHG